MAEEKRPTDDIKIKSSFLKKLDNYWYHYKWHTIISLFVIIAVLICSLQMCTKDEYDIEVMYAGPHNLNDKQTVLDIEGSFAALAKDTSGDGKVTVNLVSYWINSSLTSTEDGEEISKDNLGYSAYQSADNQKLFVEEIKTGNITVCLLSPELFRMMDEGAWFMRVTDVFPELAAYEEDVCVHDADGKINRFGVVLSKTEFGDQPGLSALPDDTVLCVSKQTAQGFWLFGKKQAEKHQNATELFSNAMALGKKED